MKRITEHKRGKASYFIVETLINGNAVDVKEINVQTAEVKKDGKTYYLLYDSYCNIIHDAYMFLNHRKKVLSETTMSAARYDLRYLYIYGELIEKDIKEFERDDFLALAYFLRGISVDDTMMEVHLLTKRGVDAINGMFSSYRSFYRYLQLDGPIFDDGSWSRYIPRGKMHHRRSVSPFTSHKVQEVPKYISVEEFSAIISWIRENVSNREQRLRDEALIRLMFEGGLRLGEALGLTLEDLEVHDITRPDGSRQEVCYIYIRNRVSDNHDFQNAKGCITVTSRSMYASHDYQTYGRGYQLSFINMDTYQLVMDYIDVAHVTAKKKHYTAYTAHEADAVGQYKDAHKTNYYVFINCRGTPMSDETWRTELRKIFAAVGIEVDYGKKRDGLSHRFRHGFIMHLLYDLKLTKNEVMKRSRHSSEAGLEKYNTPTLEQIVAIQMEIENDILQETETIWEEHRDTTQ